MAAIDLLREAQVPALAFVLLLAAAAKLAQRGSPRTAGIAVIELLTGVGLFLTANAAARFATVIVFATAAWVVEEHRHAGKPCGCFGSFSRVPAGRRSVARAVLLTVAAVASSEVPATGLAILGRGWPVVVVEIALLALLSPELDTLVRRRNVPCDLRDIPLADTYAALRSSEAWRIHMNILTSDRPSDVWRERCDRFVAFAAESRGRPAHVVFAVRHGAEGEVLAAVVTESAATGAAPGPIRFSTHL